MHCNNVLITLSFLSSETLQKPLKYQQSNENCIKHGHIQADVVGYGLCVTYVYLSKPAANFHLDIEFAFLYYRAFSFYQTLNVTLNFIRSNVLLLMVSGILDA